MIDIIDLLVVLFFVSHFFACSWILIGKQALENEDGWIYENSKNGIQKPDYWSLYISAVYWVITSFSSVGYGDIKGHTPEEYQFQIVVEMIGIGFYGYMIGTFQQIFASIQSKDQLADQQESLDHWLISLHKARKNTMMPHEAGIGVRDFYNNKYKYDAMSIHET